MRNEPATSGGLQVVSEEPIERQADRVGEGVSHRDRRHCVAALVPPHGPGRAADAGGDVLDGEAGQAPLIAEARAGEGARHGELRGVVAADADASRGLEVGPLVSLGVRIPRWPRGCSGPLVRHALRRCLLFRGHRARSGITPDGTPGLAAVLDSSYWNDTPVRLRFVGDRGVFPFDSNPLGVVMSLIRERRTPPEGLGPMLRAARERAGLGVRETARRAGLSSGYVADLEANRRTPSRTVAEQLADVLTLSEGDRTLVLAAAVDDAGRDHPWRGAAASTEQ